MKMAPAQWVVPDSKFRWNWECVIPIRTTLFQNYREWGMLVWCSPIIRSCWSKIAWNSRFPKRTHTNVPLYCGSRSTLIESWFSCWALIVLIFESSFKWNESQGEGHDRLSKMQTNFPFWICLLNDRLSTSAVHFIGLPSALLVII